MGHINQIVVAALVAVGTFVLIRVVYDLLAEPLSDDQKSQRIFASVTDFVSWTAFGASALR